MWEGVRTIALTCHDRRAPPRLHCVSQFFRIHPTHPQVRLLRQAAAILAAGGVVAYPTDSSYAIGCHLGDRRAVERIRRLRQLDEKHDMSLICRDLSELSVYAQVDNSNFRLLKRLLPGPYTLLLRGTREVPRQLLHPKRRTIGLRIPDHLVLLALLAEYGAPLMSTTLRMPGDALPLSDPEEIRDRLEHDVELVIDGGVGGTAVTTVLDLTGEVPDQVRAGLGPWPL